jgi:hypothetical protein
MELKRGMFFTLTALALIGLFIILSTSKPTQYQQQHMVVASNRLHSMNSFIDNIKQDSSYALYTIGFRSVVSSLDHISRTGTYLNDDEDMEELMLNGTLYNNPQFIMENNTLINWTQKMQIEAAKIGIELNITLQNLSIQQNDPWHITFSVDLRCQLQDERKLASWDFNLSSTSRIPIEGFEDPVWIVEAGDQIPHVINISPHVGSFANDTDVQNITEHLENAYYLSFGIGPNYLSRLEGDLTASDPTGIESFVDKEVLETITPIDPDKTSIDYLYFSSLDPQAYHFMHMPPTFALDNSTNGSIRRIAFYNLTHLVS